MRYIQFWLFRVVRWVAAHMCGQFYESWSAGEYVCTFMEQHTDVKRGATVVDANGAHRDFCGITAVRDGNGPVKTVHQQRAELKDIETFASIRGMAIGESLSLGLDPGVDEAYDRDVCRVEFVRAAGAYMDLMISTADAEILAFDKTAITSAVTAGGLAVSDERERELFEAWVEWRRGIAEVVNALGEYYDPVLPGEEPEPAGAEA